MEAEFTAASVVLAQALGVRELLREFGVKCNKPKILYADNQAALKQLGGDGPTVKSKHVHVRIKFCELTRTEWIIDALPGKLSDACGSHEESGYSTLDWRS